MDHSADVTLGNLENRFAKIHGLHVHPVDLREPRFAARHKGFVGPGNEHLRRRQRFGEGCIGLIVDRAEVIALAGAIEDPLTAGVAIIIVARAHHAHAVGLPIGDDRVGPLDILVFARVDIDLDHFGQEIAFGAASRAVTLEKERAVLVVDVQYVSRIEPGVAPCELDKFAVLHVVSDQAAEVGEVPGHVFAADHGHHDMLVADPAESAKCALTRITGFLSRQDQLRPRSDVVQVQRYQHLLPAAVGEIGEAGAIGRNSYRAHVGLLDELACRDPALGGRGHLRRGVCGLRLRLRRERGGHCTG